MLALLVVGTRRPGHAGELRKTFGHRRRQPGEVGPRPTRGRLSAISGTVATTVRAGVRWRRRVPWRQRAGVRQRRNSAAPAPYAVTSGAKAWFCRAASNGLGSEGSPCRGGMGCMPCSPKGAIGIVEAVEQRMCAIAGVLGWRSELRRRSIVLRLRRRAELVHQRGRWRRALSKTPGGGAPSSKECSAGPANWGGAVNCGGDSGAN